MQGDQRNINRNRGLSDLTVAPFQFRVLHTMPFFNSKKNSWRWQVSVSGNGNRERRFRFSRRREFYGQSSREGFRINFWVDHRRRNRNTTMGELSGKLSITSVSAAARSKHGFRTSERSHLELLRRRADDPTRQFLIPVRTRRIPTALLISPLGGFGISAETCCAVRDKTN